MHYLYPNGSEALLKNFFFFSKKPKKHHSSFITPALAQDACGLAHLHKRCFPLGWEEESFQKFLQDEQFFCFVARKVGAYKQILGFVLIRLVLDEAEIITIAVDENYRKQGIGYHLLSHAMRVLDDNGIHKLFLEVEEHNEAAQMLYKKLNFLKIGRRTGYYQLSSKQAERKRSDALIFCYDFMLKHRKIMNQTS